MTHLVLVADVAGAAVVAGTLEGGGALPVGAAETMAAPAPARRTTQAYFIVINRTEVAFIDAHPNQQGVVSSEKEDVEVQDLLKIDIRPKFFGVLIPSAMVSITLGAYRDGPFAV